MNDNKACTLIQELYDITPTHIPTTYSNKNLSFLEAACTWIDDSGATVQLRKAFEHKEKLFGLYDKNEVLAHEYVHAFRHKLASEKYEEFFAYHTSKSFGAHFRAFFGPIFTAPKEVYLFFAAYLLPFLFLPFAPHLFELSLLLPLCTTSYFLRRLFQRHTHFRRCAQKVPLQLMVRLYDEEIDRFSRSTKEQIFSWIDNARKTTPRWQDLYDRYCK